MPSFLRSWTFWLLLAFFAFEFFLFDQFGAHRYTSIYPRFNDQIQYLGESYAGYELVRTRGVLAGLLNALTNPSAQGTLHDFLAIVIFVVAGPSRSAALAVNMFALIGWQVALFVALARTTGSRPLAFAAAMLPLVLAGPWQNVPGSAFDFRLDHLAMCALGITAATALLADGFFSRSGSTWFGVAVGFTLLTRFLTGTYFVLIFAGFAVWTLSRPPDRAMRFLNLLRAGFIATAIAGPIFWLNYESVREYYLIGHYFGPESGIRSSSLGFLGSARFVFDCLAQRHLGLPFTLFVAAGALALGLTRTQVRQPAHPDPWVVGLVFLLSPALVLILHIQKSEAVIGALAAGAVTLAAALWDAAAWRAGERARTRFAVAAVLAAGVLFARTQLSPAFPPDAIAELRQVNAIADRLFARVKAMPLRSGERSPHPRVAVDYITDALDAQVLRVFIYERKRRLIPFEMTLPISIAEPPEAEVMSRLARSDFVFLTEGGAAANFPFDRKLIAMRPQLQAWCEANLRVAERFTFQSRRMVLYQRRDIPLP